MFSYNYSSFEFEFSLYTLPFDILHLLYLNLKAEGSIIQSCETLLQRRSPCKVHNMFSMKDSVERATTSVITFNGIVQ